MEKAREVVREELAGIYPQLQELRKDLEGKRAALYVGGAFKAFSLIKSFRLLGMKVVLAGSQTGTRGGLPGAGLHLRAGHRDRGRRQPLELMTYLIEKDVDVFVGGVKERPIAYKLGIGFCDHNHERKLALEGFVGMLNFAEEVHATAHEPGVALHPPPEPARHWRWRHEKQPGREKGLCLQHQRLQGLHAPGRLPGLQGHRGLRAFPARLPGLRHLYAALSDQPFPGAGGHRQFVVG
jgi:hypothetical protein